MLRRLILLLILALQIAVIQAVSAAQLLLDHGTQAAGLWCFPVATNPNQYQYLPAKARLGSHDDGSPQFSFLLYVIDAPDAGSEVSAGGILHFLLEYHTPKEQVLRAQDELREITGNEDIELTGSIIFDEGKYVLTSSILAGEGVPEMGRAPVLEGNRIALSFHLESDQAMLLEKSLQMETPDLSVSFDMTFSGVSDAYDASVSFDWEKVHSAMSASASGSYYFVGADIKKEVDSLMQNQTIKLESRGSDDATEALVNRTYDRIVALLFEPLEMQKLPKADRDDLFGKLGKLLGGGESGPIGSNVFGLRVGFKLKKIERQGTAELQFNHSQATSRDATITFNFADTFQQYGHLPGFFRKTNISNDPARQRTVHVIVDGELAPEFGKLVNAVEIRLRKKHNSGNTTLREITLNPLDINDQNTSFKYGWQDDTLPEWLDYEYEVLWSFRGGGRYGEGWHDSSASVINLYAPYERKQIPVIYDRDKLVQLGIRAVELEVSYQFFEETRHESIIIFPHKQQTEPVIEITLPQGQPDYEYKTTYTDTSGVRKTKVYTDSGSLIFIENNS